MNPNITVRELTCDHAKPKAKEEQNAEEVEHRARLMEIAQKYTLHIRVVDPDGREILNVTKLTLGRNLHEEGDTIPALQDVLELLIEAAEEHLLPSD